MIVLTIVSATFAVAGIMDLPVFGLGGGDAITTNDATETGGVSDASTQVVTPEIVEEVVYQDVFDRVARPSPVAASPPPPVVAPVSSAPPPSSPTSVTKESPPSTPSTTRATVTTRSVTSTRSAAATRSAPPPSCEEPEWDREYQRWHCKGD